jgi:hypothetical protein
MLSIALVTGGKEVVLDALYADPMWRRMTAKGPVTVAAMLAAKAQELALTDLRGMLGPELEHTYNKYLETNGERDPNDAGEWDEGLDDAIANVFEPYEKYLSASWMGVHLIDTRAHIEGEMDRLVDLFGQEVWTQLTYERTNNQILAGVGIVEADLLALCDAPPPPPPPPKEYNSMSVNAVLNIIMRSFPDMMQLPDDLDMVSDTDDLLAEGAAGRLGIQWEDVLVLRDARSRSSAALDAWFNAIDAGIALEENKVFVDLTPPPVPPPPTADLGPDLPATLRRSAPPPPPPPPPPPSVTASAGVPPPPPPPSAVKGGSSGEAPSPPNTGRGGARAKAGDAPPPGAIPAELLQTIKDRSGMTDVQMAEALGISRPTFANYLKNKGWCVPTPQQRLLFKNKIAETINVLTEAHNAIE